MTILLAAMTCWAAAAETQPATRPATQPAMPTMAKCYALMKNEFMVTEGGKIVLTTDEVRGIVNRIRQEAAQEKREVDAQIASQAGAARSADQANKAAQARAAEIRREGSREANRKDSSTYSGSQQVGEYRVYGSRTRTYDVHNKTTQKQIKEQAQRQAAAAKQQADSHKQAARGATAEIAELKKRSSELAVVSSPHNRAVPPKSFWGELSVAEQDLLSRVGITLDQFKTIVLDGFLDESKFLLYVHRIELKKGDVIAELRTFFKKYQ